MGGEQRSKGPSACQKFLLLVIFGLAFIASPSRAAVPGLAGLLAASSVGIIDRKENNDYANKLGIDKRATVLLHLGKGLCTGTFISSTVVLTAEHCVDRKSKSGRVNIEGIESIGVIVNEKYDGSASAKGTDLSALLYPPGTGEALGISHYPRMARNTIDVGALVYLIGYGMDNYFALKDPKRPAGAGVKGWATTKIKENAEGRIATEIRHVATPKNPQDLTERPASSGEPSVGLPGDSGGAVYGENGEVVGIVQAVGNVPVTKQTGRFIVFPIYQLLGWDISNYFTDVTTDDNQALIARALAAGEKGPTFEGLFENPNNVFAREGGEFGHITLRTGVYGSDGQPDLYVVPYYVDHKLRYAEVLTRIDGRFQNSQGLLCMDKVCLDPRREDQKEIFVVGKQSFVRVPITRSFSPTTMRSNEAIDYTWLD
jgi:hypothetical protein